MAVLTVLALLPGAGLWTSDAAAQRTADRAASPTHREQAPRSQSIDELRRSARQHDDTPSLLARAGFAEMDGDLEQARRFAQAARQASISPAALGRSTATIARYDREMGNWEEAENLLRASIAEQPAELVLRLELAELLLARGQRREAEIVLEAISGAYNQGRIGQSADLAILGRALMLLGSYSDANYALRRAVRDDPEDLQARLWHGELFLSRYNTADAERSFMAILERVSDHPDALVAMARLEMTSDRDFDAAREYLRRARAVAAGHAGLQIVEAELAVYDGDCRRSLAITDDVLRSRPKHLGALSLRAACFYLLDDTGAFEQVRQFVDGFRTNDSRVLVETANFAALFHRYAEAVDLYREALSRDERDAEAMVGLGIGLSRTGHETEAVETLRRAFAADSFHVRAYNMLEFYDKAMPDYVFVDHDRFSLRAHKSQYEVIEQLYVPVVAEALATFDAKYGFAPSQDLAIEVYGDPQAFAVRSVGLPHISPHGICFGKVVLSRSPSDGNFNWRQVLWHELAHVYHLQLADARMPRWFTEGLAEYETNVKDASWIRHHDHEIARAVFQGEVPSVIDLDRGFTHARSLYEVVVAYQLSSLAIHFIVERHGFDAVVAMLRAWGERKQTTDVLEGVLGQTVTSFDEAFRQWLRGRYSYLSRQFDTVGSSPEPLENLEAMARSLSEDGHMQARLALGRLARGDRAGAERDLARALSLAPGDSRVRWIAARMMMHLDRPLDAYEHGKAILLTHRDGYELRLLMARAALLAEKPVSADVHYGAATELYPNGLEAWLGLYELAAGQGDERRAGEALRRLFDLDQNDPAVARRWTERALAEVRVEEACAAARRWLDIQPFDAQAPRTMVRAALACGRPDQADDAFALLMRLDPRRRHESYLWYVAQLTAAGFSDKAQHWARRAQDDGAAPQAIEEALNAPLPGR
jgi:cellulose synthase operon protein C